VPIVCVQFTSTINLRVIRGDPSGVAVMSRALRNPLHALAIGHSFGGLIVQRCSRRATRAPRSRSSRRRSRASPSCRRRRSASPWSRCASRRTAGARCS
jgi:hypothetical protein